MPKIAGMAKKFIDDFWADGEYRSESYHRGYEAGVKEFIKYIESNFEV